MRLVILCSTLVLLASALVGCSHIPTSQDTIFACKTACRGQVSRYVDDTIECQCKDLKVSEVK